MDFKRPLGVVTPTLDGDVLAVLAGAEEAFSGRRIHRVLGMGSESGVRKVAERLTEQGIVLRRRAGQANLYELNRAHVAAPYIMGLATLRTQLFDRLRGTISGWKPLPLAAMVFGSVARGEATAHSDLDLLVIRPSGIEEENDQWREQLVALEERASEWTGNEARVLEYGEGELGDAAVRRVVEEALADGFELHGSRRSLRGLVEKEGL